MPENTQTTGSKEREVQLVDEIKGAEYANMLWVNHSQEEFLLNFVTLIGKEGKVVSKIIITPGHAKRILNTLLDNMKMYEKNFGVLKEIANVAPIEKEGGEETNLSK